MRISFKNLQGITATLAQATGDNYVTYAADARVGGYLVGIKAENHAYENAGYIPEPIITGTASECWYGVRAILAFQRREKEKQEQQPQFIVLIADGMLQSILTIGPDNPIKYLIVDEDALKIAYEEEHGTIPDDMTDNDVLKAAVTAGLQSGELLYTSPSNVADLNPETVCQVLGYNLPPANNTYQP